MRTYTLALLSCIVLLTSGCMTFQKMDAKIPNGNWKNANLEVDGKFTNTSLTASGVKRDGKWIRGKLHFTHSNPWVLKSNLDLEVEPEATTP